MSSQDFVRYLTQRLVEYVDSTEKKKIKPQNKQFSTTFFGVLPLSLKLYMAKIIKFKKISNQ